MSAPVGDGAARPDADCTDLRFGYGTNGFTNHRLDDRSPACSPTSATTASRSRSTTAISIRTPTISRGEWTAWPVRLDALGLTVTVETGAPYLLDPWHKHVPTLMSDAGTERRVDLLRRAIRIAADLGSPTVHVCSGPPPAGLAEDLAWKRLAAGCAAVLETARSSTSRWASSRSRTCSSTPSSGA